MDLPFIELVKIGLTVTGALLLQAFAAVRWLNKRFGQLEAHSNQYRQATDAEIRRLDREMGEIRERLAAVPTGPQIEAILDRRIGRVEDKLDTLLLSTAATRRSRHLIPDDGN